MNNEFFGYNEKVWSDEEWLEVRSELNLGCQDHEEFTLHPTEIHTHDL
jgi:hypothetical protein